MKVILGSSSPRRKELLENIKVEYEVIKPVANEDMSQKMSYEKLSESLSYQKAKEVFDKTDGDRLVIGSDCMVYYKKHLLGKPKNIEDAKTTLKMLSNSWHKVVTGLCVLVEQNGQVRKYLTHDVTKVKFKKLTDFDIDRYLLSKEYSDKAGSYAVQGYAGAFVDRVVGNLSTVIGLPIHKLYDILKKENIIKG